MDTFFKMLAGFGIAFLYVLSMAGFHACIQEVDVKNGGFYYKGDRYEIRLVK